MLVTVLRWIAASIAALLALGAIFNFGLYIAIESRPLLERARRLGAWIRLLALAWFNAEVWGRVVYTLVHWVS
jgi:hypothetical protein